MSDLGEYVSLRGEALRTFCAALTADAGEAEAIAERASRAADSRAVRRGDVGVDVAVWRAAVHEYVTSRRDRTQARARAVRVLRELEDLDPRDIAPLVGRRPRWVERQLARAALRPDGLDVVPPNRRRLRWLAVGVVVVLLGAGVTAVARARDRGPAALESGAPPRATGLLPWPARGELGRDRRLHSAAAAVWRAVDSQVGATSVLWGGRISGGRLVILQALVGGLSRIAVVGDGDRGLYVLTSVETPLAPTVLVVDYAGPIPRATTDVDGATLREVRLLAAPEVRTIERRGLRTLDLRDPQGTAIGDWRSVSLHDGLTDFWMERADGAVQTALRVDGSADWLLPATGIEPLRVDVQRWTGSRLPAFDTGALSVPLDEVLLAQALRTPQLRVRALAPDQGQDGALYAVSTQDCVDCVEVFRVYGQATARGPGLSYFVEPMPALTSPAGAVVLDYTSHLRLLAPPTARACAFGTRPPRLSSEQPWIEGPDIVIDRRDYDGAYVCVDAHGKVVDRSGHNTGFAAAG